MIFGKTTAPCDGGESPLVMVIVMVIVMVHLVMVVMVAVVPEHPVVNQLMVRV